MRNTSFALKVTAFGQLMNKFKILLCLGPRKNKLERFDHFFYIRKKIVKKKREVIQE